jgi:tetratricopeptide (TPR) repeat protein
MNSSFWTRAVTQIGALTIAAFSTSFFATNLIADQLEPPNGNEPKHELAEGHQVLPDSEQDEALRFERIGDDLSREAKTQEALDAYRKALKIRQTLDGQRQSDANERRNLARVYLKVGDSLEVQQFKQHINDVLGTRSVGGVRVKRQQFDFNKNSGIQEAADAFQQSLKIWQSLADSSPSDQIARDGLATALEKLGGIFFYSNEDWRRLGRLPALPEDSAIAGRTERVRLRSTRCTGPRLRECWKHAGSSRRSW